MSRFDRRPRSPLQPKQTRRIQTISVYDVDLWNAARKAALTQHRGLSWIVEAALRLMLAPKQTGSHTQ